MGPQNFVLPNDSLYFLHAIKTIPFCISASLFPLICTHFSLMLIENDTDGEYFCNKGSIELLFWLKQKQYDLSRVFKRLYSRLCN